MSLRSFCWRCSVLIALLGGGCAATQPGAEDESAVIERGPHYAPLIGRSYRTQQALYLFIADADSVFIGRHDDRVLPDLPVEIAGRNAGKICGRYQILDVVPAGSELEIMAETHELTTTSPVRGHGGIPMGFLCRVRYQGRQLDGVRAEFIQAAEPAAPGVLNQRLDERFVAPISG